MGNVPPQPGAPPPAPARDPNSAKGEGEAPQSKDVGKKKGIDVVFVDDDPAEQRISVGRYLDAGVSVKRCMQLNSVRVCSVIRCSVS